MNLPLEPGEVSVCITVRDNGNGIPQKVVDKIFQPFFTTKPPGLGSVLVLSLSYDIVKAHGGMWKKKGGLLTWGLFYQYNRDAYTRIVPGIKMNNQLNKSK